MRSWLNIGLGIQSVPVYTKTCVRICTEYVVYKPLSLNSCKSNLVYFKSKYNYSFIGPSLITCEVGVDTIQTLSRMNISCLIYTLPTRLPGYKMCEYNAEFPQIGSRDSMSLVYHTRETFGVHKITTLPSLLSYRHVEILCPRLTLYF